MVALFNCDMFYCSQSQANGLPVCSHSGSLKPEPLSFWKTPFGSYFFEAAFSFFLRKQAPVSGVQSLLDYQGRWIVEGDAASPVVWTEVAVPVKSLCPCSKEISDYGAHNQRSHVTVSVRSMQPISPESLIAMVEAQASCELYGLLKRVDEKYVTERAYDNPKFVEDLVRDVAGAVKADARVASFTVEAENFESIHNHSAYARIDG